MPSLERLDRLAIIIVGQPHAGKTTTLKHWCDYYYDTVSTFKQGWRYRVVPFRPKFETIKIWPFVIPSSRTERATSLADTLNEDWLPDVLLMAEQVEGIEYSNTIHFLMSNSYHIKEFNISNVVGDGVWDRWTPGDILRQNGKLLQRREQIADYIRNFLLEHAS